MAVSGTFNIAGKGVLNLASNGTYTFTPAPGFSGSVAIPYTVYDDNINVDSAKATLHILVGLPLPLQLPESNVVLQGGSTTGDLSTNDQNIPAGTTYAIPTAKPSNPTAAVPTVNANGTYTFTSNTPGDYYFNMPIVLPIGDTLFSELKITVLPVNAPKTPPFANNDIVATANNTQVIINTLGNDGVYPGSAALDTSSVIITIPAMNGTATVNTSNGEITYTPNTGFSGLDTIKYLVKDKDGNTATAMQIIQVLAPNAKNITMASDDYASTANSTPVSGNVLKNDSDPEGDNQYVVAQNITLPGQGTLVLNANSAYTFTPAPGFSGNVSFPYTNYDVPTAIGSNVDSAKATLSIIVAPEPPVVLPDIMVVAQGQTASANLSTNDKVPAGSTYATPASNPANPSSDVPTVNANGTYTFNSNTPGEYNFDIPATLPGGAVVINKLKVTVTPAATAIAQPPIANTDLVATKEGVPVTIATLDNDVANPNGAPINIAATAITTAPKNGIASVNSSTGQITYTPTAGFVGNDTITYQIQDANGNTATAQQIIMVRPVNAANITIAADNFEVTKFETSISKTVLSNDMDPEGDDQFVVPQNFTFAVGTFVLNADGTYTVVPPTGFKGLLAFPYVIYDNNINVDSAKATLYVLVGDEPKSIADMNITYVNITVNGSVRTNDEDTSRTTYTYVGASASNPTLDAPNVNVDGTYDFASPLPGRYVFTTKACAICEPTELIITVIDSTIRTNAPIVNIDNRSVVQGNPIRLNPLGNDHSANSGDSLNPASVTLTQAPKHGTASVNPTTGLITYQSNGSYVGKDTMKYVVCNSNLPAQCDSTYIIINVLPANAPNNTDANDDVVTSIQDSVAYGNVLENDGDAQNDVQSTVPQNITISGKGQFTLDANGNFTFTPIAGYIGTVDIPYKTNDDNINPAKAMATLYILIKGNVFTVLTVESIKLTGTKIAEGHQLNWTTNNEKNASELVVMRSLDGNNFQSITTMPALSKSQGAGNYQYQFIDTDPQDGDNYYRIIIKDDVGAQKVSNTIVLNKSNEEVVKLYPNPATSEINLQFTLQQQNAVTIKIADASGKTVRIIEVASTIGATVVTLDVSELASGTYTVQMLVAKKAIWQSKLTKQ
jgi:CshA-type fibril repeat protein